MKSNKEYFEETFSRFKNLKIGIIGDFCLDLYWHVDMLRSTLSNESPFCTLPVVCERTSLGAAGNVVANLVELNTGKIYAIGVSGSDWRSKFLIDELKLYKCVENHIIASDDLKTTAYCRLLRFGLNDSPIEGSRIDFVNDNIVSKTLERRILAELEIICSKIDVLIVNDQLQQGMITKNIRNRINDIASNGITVIVDSRYRIGLYKKSILKINKYEGLCAVYGQKNIRFDELQKYGIEKMAEVAERLSKKTDSIVVLTLGKDGAVIYQNTQAVHIEAVYLHGEIDGCGAGDAFIATLSLLLASGMSVNTSAEIACAAAAVTVKKIGMTGTANKQEILDLLSSKK